MFNLHRIIRPARTVVLVESYFSVFNLHMLDFPVISPMGRSLSEKQIELLKETGTKNVVLLFDGDDPGRTAVTTVGRLLLVAGFEVTAPVVPENFKPHRIDGDALRSVLNKC